MCRLPEKCGDVCESCLSRETPRVSDWVREPLAKPDLGEDEGYVSARVSHPAGRALSVGEVSVDDVSFRAGYDQALIDDFQQVARLSEENSRMRELLLRFMREVADVFAGEVK